MNSKNTEEKIKNILHPRIDLINISKILIISFTAFYLLGNFIPFYESDDASIFAFTSIQLSRGEYTITNELLEETGNWSFIPRHWTKTIYNTALPDIELGFPTVGAIAYIVAGNNGLFYVNAIIATIFFIVADRISTNLFGRLVGLLTIIFLASNFWVIRFASFTMSDMLFVLVFIIGLFYFMKYLNQSSEKYLLLASVIFGVSAFIRIIGSVFFLVEIFVISSFVIYHVFLKNKYNKDSGDSNQKTKLKFITVNRSLKIVFSIIVPWSIFFLFLVSFNDYYFGNPLTVKEFVSQQSDFDFLEEIEVEYGKLGIPVNLNQPASMIITEAREQGILIKKTHSILTFEPENIMGYFRAVLPFPLSHDIEPLERNEDLLGKYWIGFLTPVLLGSIFLISYKKNIKRKEITVFTIFLLSIILLYAALPAAEGQLERNSSQRYSIPAFTLFSMMIGLMIIEILKTKSINTKIFKAFLKSFKITLIVFLIIFFIVAFYFTPPFQAISNGNFKFQNPEVISEKYPLDNEGLTSQSILLDSKGHLTADRGVIPMRSVGSSILPEYYPVLAQSLEVIFKIKDLMTNGYEIFVNKEPDRPHDKIYFQYIVENHDLILKSYSKSFCKFYFPENSQSKSDEICL